MSLTELETLEAKFAASSVNAQGMIDLQRDVERSSTDGTDTDEEDPERWDGMS